LRKSALATNREITRADEFYAPALHLPFILITNWHRKKARVAEFPSNPGPVAMMLLGKKMGTSITIKKYNSNDEIPSKEVSPNDDSFYFSYVDLP
jgi:hypothetical protein